MNMTANHIREYYSSIINLWGVQVALREIVVKGPGYTTTFLIFQVVDNVAFNDVSRPGFHIIKICATLFYVCVLFIDKKTGFLLTVFGFFQEPPQPTLHHYLYSLVTIQNGQFSLWYNRTLCTLHILQSGPLSRIDHLHSKHYL